MERYNPDLSLGLTKLQVEQRKKDRLVNYDTNINTKSIKTIIVNNIFTLFNILNFGLALAIVLVNSYKNLLFIGVVFCNTAISIYQEIQAKKVVDKLSIIASVKVKVIRDGIEKEIHINEIVLDDIVKLKIGNQIVTDAIIKEGNVIVDESSITGESDQVEKGPGEMLLSGSYIVSGKCLAQVEHISLDNYTAQISHEAKYLKKPNSQIMKTLQKIIKLVSFVIIPLGLIQFWHQYGLTHDIQEAVVSTVASVISMIPEGLVLLTSTVLIVSVIRLAKRTVLVKELFCIETLARVDVLCLDKTGTITEGTFNVKEIFAIDKNCNIKLILANLATTLGDENNTMIAIKEYCNQEGFWVSNKIIPFSSKNKYSGVTYQDYGTFLIGAPELLTDDLNVLQMVKCYEEYRTLLLVRATRKDSVNQKYLVPLGIVVIEEKIRPTALETLEYFRKQSVDIKIISGDGQVSVSNIAKKIGINQVKALTLSGKSIEEIEKSVKDYNVFCRVSPYQKKIIIKSLKRLGHTIAMVGDGVNDVLALKEADCSIALANGSEAARNVSEIVLLNSDFDSLPQVVAEGRRTINNVERSASLFLTKTIYATILSLIFLFVNLNYPFEPIQMSLISSLTIGIPAFILALEPNEDMVKGNFFINVMIKSIPTALTIVIDIIGVIILSNILKVTPEQTSTMAVVLVTLTAFMMLFRTCYPFDIIRKIMYICLLVVFVICIFELKTLFSLVSLRPIMILFIAVLCLLDILLYRFLIDVCERKIINNQEKILR